MSWASRPRHQAAEPATTPPGNRAGTGGCASPGGDRLPPCARSRDQPAMPRWRPAHEDQLREDVTAAATERQPTTALAAPGSGYRAMHLARARAIVDDMVANAAGRCRCSITSPLVADAGEQTSASRLREAIKVGNELTDLSDALIGRFVAEARANGLSWTEIGDVFGTSKQAVQQRYGAGSDELGRWPERWTPDANDAFDRAGQHARDLGHGYVGTEQFLSVMPRLKQSLEHGRRIADELDARLADTEHLLPASLPSQTPWPSRSSAASGSASPTCAPRSPGNSTWSPSGSVRPVAAADGHASSRAELARPNRRDPAQGRPGGGGRRCRRAGTYHRTAWPRRKRLHQHPGRHAHR
jgi:hypothetical protein